ncbi:MAG: hypothetical protein JXB47_05160 [Anaerolineae bacterium]|nr:hypothetical protein [Anaerolineae bacterium]
MENVKAALRFALGLGIVGLVVGAVAGWWSMMQADDAGGLASASVPLYTTLAVILPAALGAATVADLRGAHRAAYEGLGQSLTRLLVAGFCGSALATVLFTAGAFQIPVVFAELDPAELMPALRDKVMDHAPLVVGVTTLVSAGIAAWADQQATGRKV